MDRQAELDSLKREDLTVIAANYGYEVVKAKSTKSSVLMTNSSDKIIVTKKGSTYLFCSVYDNNRNGTVIDFIAHEKGLMRGNQPDFKAVMEELRPYLGAGVMDQLRQQHQGKYATVLQNQDVDLDKVQNLVSRFLPLQDANNYLTSQRAIPLDVLTSSRLQGTILVDPRSDQVIFPTRGYHQEVDREKRYLVGFERRGENLNVYAKGGVKGLWMSRAFTNDRTLVVCEAGIDAVSYLAYRGLAKEPHTRVASVGGSINDVQKILLQSAIAKLPEGCTVSAGFDNDKQGDRYTQLLDDIYRQVNRSDLTFKEQRPMQRGQDWNDVHVDQAVKQGLFQKPSLGFTM